jgi:hypothetical protein
MLKSRRMAAHVRCASITKLLLRDVFSCDMPYVVPCDDIFIVKLLLVIGSRRPFDMRHVLYRDGVPVLARTKLGKLGRSVEERVAEEVELGTDG